ncbi:hypothetical protein LCGC14_0837650 [marine sediment metagenome]|uniref:LamG-like jellyroll fold domain-containing protein n=1 Tax=marine sediment metagenome TaxID=412755 RepID=A0A0F9SLG6_9ZZZZ
MRKFCKAALLSTVAVLLIATPILAFLYQAPFTIIEDAGTDYDMFPASVDANNTFMADNGFMEVDALDTRVETLAGSDKPHMVADDRTLGAVPVEANSQTNLFFTTGETDLASMNIITGFDGFVTIPDNATLEPGDDFEIECQDAFIDTSAGADKNLLTKGTGFSISVSAAGSIEAAIALIPGSWTEVAPQLNAETQIFSLVVLGGKLYGSTASLGNLFEWNGTNAWVQVAPQHNAQVIINALAVFNGKIYGGTSGGGRLFEWNGVNAWVQVAPQLAAETGIISLAVHNGKLYGGTSPNGNLYEWNDVNLWVQVAPQLNAQTIINALAVHNGKLYGGTSATGRLFEWNDVNLWVQAAPQLAELHIRSLAVHNGKLYGGTANGGRLYEWNDVNLWVQVAPQLNAQIRVTSLVVFAGQLYGGTGALGNLFLWNDVNAWVQAAAQLGAESSIDALAVFNDVLYGGTAALGKLARFDATLTVTAVNQTSGEHDVKVTADTVNLEISIDGAVAGDGFDTVALAGASVPDNANDWLIIDNSTTPFMPYMASFQLTVSDVLHAWYAPNTIVENTGEVGTADAGTATTLDDAILTQANDFWNGAKLIIVTTTDSLAPEGESSAITDFDAALDRLTFDALTAVVDVGDTYTIDFGTLVDRSFYGIEFDGTDDQVLVTDAVTVQNVFDAGGTLSLWANVTSDGENNAGRLADKTSWYLATDNEAGGATKLTFFYDFDGAADGTWVTDNAVTTIGSWDNIVVVYDNSAVANNPTIYVNNTALTVGSGLTESTTPIGTRVTDAAINLVIGDNVASNRAYDGLQDEVWLYSRSITGTEVTANYNAGVGAYVPSSSVDLELELHIEDGSGAVATDTSGNSNNGALTNAVWVNGHVPRTAGLGGTNDSRITWGVNPTGISVTLGSMVAASQPVIGAAEDVPARDILPPITVSDWFGDGTVSGSTLTNPIRPLITAMSDNTTLTEIQVWRLMGIIAVLFATVATAFTVRGHQGITAIVAGVMLGGLVAFDSNIFPMWTLVIAAGLFIAGIVAERSPSL